MKCDRCGVLIPEGDEMEYYGQVLCERCYMQALSPAQACDPWAVRSAKTLSQMDDTYSTLSAIQANVLRVLDETGGLELTALAKSLQIELPELERELATLRHMEKVRAELRAGRKIIVLWES
jgi:hypothetical protein